MSGHPHHPKHPSRPAQPRATMYSPDRYVGLAHLFRDYFHPDWMEECSTPREAVQRFAFSEAPHMVSLALADVRRVLAAHVSEATLQDMLDAWGCEYYLPNDGISARRWLEIVERWLSPPAYAVEIRVEEWAEGA
jgi:hypothetical protein